MAGCIKALQSPCSLKYLTEEVKSKIESINLVNININTNNITVTNVTQANTETLLTNPSRDLTKILKSLNDKISRNKQRRTNRKDNPFMSNHFRIYANLKTEAKISAIEKLVEKIEEALKTATTMPFKPSEERLAPQSVAPQSVEPGSERSASSIRDAGGMKTTKSIVEALDFNKNGHFQNVCAEMALISAAMYYKMDYPYFGKGNYTKSKKEYDKQLDLISPLVAYEVQNSRTCDMVVKLCELKEKINGLDQSLCYVIRTGTLSGPGHFSTMQFIDDKWTLCNEPRSGTFVIFDVEGNYTLASTPRLNIKGTNWGDKLTQYSISIAPIHKEHLLKLSENIMNSRAGNTNDDFQL